jgi:hypothetical protein
VCVAYEGDGGEDGQGKASPFSALQLLARPGLPGNAIGQLSYKFFLLKQSWVATQ